MQNKGLVKLFAFLFGAVSIYLLSFTFKNNQIEKQAAAIAESKFEAGVEDRKQKVSDYQVSYLDSLSSSKESVFLGSTYAKVKENSMKLGLDLKGGLEAILQVSVKDILIGLSNGSKDPTFLKALENTDEIQKNSQNDYIDDFYDAFDAIKGDKVLASPDIFANRSLREEIRPLMPDNDVKAVISNKINESITSALQVLRTRIDQFGVASPNIQRIGTSGRILVELPGVKDIARAKDLITSTAQLEFWHCLRGNDFLPFLEQANAILKAEQEATSGEETTQQEEELTEEQKAIEALTGAKDETETVVNPLLDLYLRC